MFKMKMFKKKSKSKMYAVAIRYYSTGEIALEKWDSVGLNNLDMYDGMDYEILKVIEI